MRLRAERRWYAADLSAEAIRLGRLLVELLPEPEAEGLLALMLLQESRRAARTSADGDIVLLDEQDRSLWDRDAIDEGLALVRARARLAPLRALHAAGGDRRRARRGADAGRDRLAAQIVGLYDLLLQVEPSPVVELNRAAAVAMRDGPGAGLELIDTLLARGELIDYQPIHSARAELCRRLGRAAEACQSYRRALELTRQGAARRFLERRLAKLPRA